MNPLDYGDSVITAAEIDALPEGRRRHALRDGTSVGEMAIVGLITSVDGGGTVGPVGPMGPEGPPGEDGIDGSRGPQGIPGEDGLDGAQGPQGVQGPAGATGAQGAIGPAGPEGPEGVEGAPGPAYAPTAVPVVLADADVQDIHSTANNSVDIAWTGSIDPASFTLSGAVLTAVEDMEINIHASIAVTNYTPRKDGLYSIAVRNDDYLYHGGSFMNEGIMSSQIRLFIASGEQLTIEVFTLKDNHTDTVNLDPTYSNLRIERIS